MFSRRRTILSRLMLAYKLLLGSLLLVVGLGGLFYIFVAERAEVRESAHAAASILATQSSAALMFGDTEALQENLDSLKDLEGLHWAAIVPTAVDVPHAAVRFGAAPVDLLGILEELGDQRDRAKLFSLIVRNPISHQGVERGQLLLALDLRFEVYEFVKICIAAMVLLVAAFLLGQVVFRRIVQSIIAPLDDLIRATTTIAQQASRNGRLEDVRQSTTGVTDEVGQLADAFDLMLEAIIRHDRLERGHAQQLEQTVENLRSLSARMRAVREEERTRISHEIHDELGQRLTALKFAIARLDAGTEGNAIATQVDELIRVVRNISWDLRPSLLDSLGLVAAIEWQAQDFSRRMGIHCGVDLPDEAIDIAPDMATDLFRVCQELLTNVSRHARASRVDIILEMTDDAIHLEVKDNGCGMQARDQSRPALGLLGIRERVESWGGRIDIGPANGATSAGGTRVHIMIPRVRGGTPISSEQTP